jgi:hypothetical protein
MKTILVFLLSLTLAMVLPNPVWAHGGSGAGGSHGGGGAGGSSSAGNGGARGGAVGPGGGKGVGVAHGPSNGLAPALGRAIGLVAKGLGRSNGQEISKGGSNVTTHGRGFGFGQASIGNPGHHALSGQVSHSQNTSHRGGPLTAEAFPTTLTRSTLWRRITWLTLRRQIGRCRLMTIHFRPNSRCRLIAA